MHVPTLRTEYHTVCPELDSVSTQAILGTYGAKNVNEECLTEYLFLPEGTLEQLFLFVWHVAVSFLPMYTKILRKTKTETRHIPGSLWRRRATKIYRRELYQMSDA